MHGSVFLENAGHQDGTTLLSFIENNSGPTARFFIV
jgi:hypothetical protein